MMFLYFLGSVIIYACRTAMSLCMPEMYDEFGWDKKQQVSEFHSRYIYDTVVRQVSNIICSRFFPTKNNQIFRILSSILHKKGYLITFSQAYM